MSSRALGYPKNFDATEFGEFGVLSHTVSSHNYVTIGLFVQSDDGPDDDFEFFFESSEGGEQFYELVIGTNRVSTWSESWSTGFDEISTNNVTGLSPSVPADTLFLERSSNDVDDPFVEIIVNS